ncbi:unnamed protein product, partial [Ectocarpus fasciculatus]
FPLSHLGLPLSFQICSCDAPGSLFGPATKIDCPGAIKRRSNCQEPIPDHMITSAHTQNHDIPLEHKVRPSHIYMRGYSKAIARSGKHPLPTLTYISPKPVTSIYVCMNWRHRPDID